MEKGSAIEKFVKYMLIINMSLTTIETYERDVRLFLLEIAEAEVQEITRHTIEKYLIDLTKKEIKSSVIKKKHASLKAFFKFLFEQKIIATNPLAIGIKIPKNLKPKKVYISKEKAEQIVYSLLSDAKKPLKDKLIISIFFVSGLSLVELSQIKQEDIKKMSFKTAISNDIIRKIRDLLDIYLNEVNTETLFITGKQQPFTYKYFRKIITPFLAKLVDVSNLENFYIDYKREATISNIY